MEKLNTQVAELKGSVSSYAQLETRFAAEKASLSKQVEALNDELIRAQRRSDAVEADNRRLMQEAVGLRQSATVLQERLQMVMRRAATCGDGNKVLSTRLTAVERERDALRALVQTERERTMEIETLLQTARTQAALANTASQYPLAAFHDHD